tara:strand:- start:1877 stop:2302 length:426 start_codon:yes stop_codon:yes gene_type:complete
MNLEYCQYWISLFAKKPDELITLYDPEFLFEDINFGVRIEDDLTALKEFQEAFVNEDETHSYNKFNVWDYVGDETLGSFQWHWDAKHAGDFLGVPAAGKLTHVRGVTVMGWRDGKITLERSIWDAAAALQQLGAIPAPVPA